MLVKLSDEVSVNTDNVTHIETDHIHESVFIHMVGCGCAMVPCDYGRSIWQTADRIMKLINGDDNG